MALNRIRVQGTTLSNGAFVCEAEAPFSVSIRQNLMETALSVEAGYRANVFSSNATGAENIERFRSHLMAGPPAFRYCGARTMSG